MLLESVKFLLSFVAELLILLVLSKESESLGVLNGLVELFLSQLKVLQALGLLHLEVHQVLLQGGGARLISRIEDLDVSVLDLGTLEHFLIRIYEKLP